MARHRSVGRELLDWASNQAAGGLAAYNIGTAGPNTSRIIAGFAVAAAKAQDLFAAIEYFTFNAVITNAKTSGAGACAGCTTVRLPRVQLTQVCHAADRRPAVA